MAALTLKCDACGKVGTPKEIEPAHDLNGNRDLCTRCALTEVLRDYQRRRKEKAEWLEATHLHQLRDLDRLISETESQIASL